MGINTLALIGATVCTLNQAPTNTENVLESTYANQVLSDIATDMFHSNRKAHELMKYMQDTIEEYELEQERIRQEEIRLEQERLEQIRLEEERLEKERIEQERIKAQQGEQQRLAQEKQASYNRTNYRQTYYSVQEGETNLGSMYNVNSPEVSVINNIMHFNDSEYGNLPIYAIDMNEVVASGQNSRGTWNLYGSVIEVTNGVDTWLSIILDSCGACMTANKIDLWVYNNQPSLDVSGLDWKYVRKGW